MRAGRLSVFGGIPGAQMRLVVWNAGMAVHRKLKFVLNEMHPDFLVLSECAREDVLTKQIPGGGSWNCTKWVGSNKHKGLAVQTFGGY